MQKFADELMGESDRGCALLAASWLENAVMRRFRALSWRTALRLTIGPLLPVGI